MNPFVMQVLGYLVRQGLMMLVGALGLTHIVQPIIDANMTEFNQLVSSIALALAVLGYALWRQFKGRQKLVQALGVAGKSEQEIEQMVRSSITQTPSVLTAKHEIPG